LNPAYVAGLFDGEGYVGCKINEKGWATWRIAVVNTNRDVLEQITKEFGGSIGKKAYSKLSVKPCWMWKLSGAANLLRFTQTILPYSIIKKDKLENLKTSILTHKSKNWRGLALLSKDEIEHNYLALKKSVPQMAKEFAVCDSSMYEVLRKFGIKRRTPTEAHVNVIQNLK